MSLLYSLNDIRANPDLIQEIPTPSIEACLAAADGQMSRCCNRYYPSESVINIFDGITVSEALAIAVVQRGDCLTCFLPADSWIPAVAEAALAVDTQNILEIPKTLITSDMCRDVLERGFPWRLTGRVLEHMGEKVRREDLLAALVRMEHIIEFIPNPDIDMVLAVVRQAPHYIRYAKGCLYTTWIAVGRPQKNLKFLHMFAKIYRRARPAPDTIVGPHEDPLTLDTIPVGTTCGFLRGTMGTWHLAGTADTLADMINNRFQGSDFDRIFVPHRNKSIDFREIRWFIL